jgi:cystathionine gamma-synthase
MSDDRRNDRKEHDRPPQALVEGVSRPVVTPIQPSVVYASPSIDMLHAQYEGRETGYTYAREGHPNATLLAQKIDALEGAEGGIVTGSGMAAVTAALMGVLKAGDHVIGANQLYGRSLRLMNQDLARFGIGTSLADPTDIDAMRAAIRPETRMILVEVVSNPTLRVADMAGIAALAREAGVLLAVDNTFTTPRAWRPFEHGADIVIHSITKLLAGHSDVTLGYVAARTRDAARDLRFRGHGGPSRRRPTNAGWRSGGCTPSPCAMTGRSQRDGAGRSPRRIRRWRACSIPGGPITPMRRGRALLGARTGNMVSFEIKGDAAAANRMVEAAPQLPFAPTLGDVGTTLSHPASSSHRALTPEARAALGISDGFFRVSVGIEEIDLLMSDFDEGLAAV